MKDIVDDLSRLAELLDAGAISRDEFEILKGRLTEAVTLGSSGETIAATGEATATTGEAPATTGEARATETQDPGSLISTIATEADPSPGEALLDDPIPVDDGSASAEAGGVTETDLAPQSLSMTRGEVIRPAPQTDTDPPSPSPDTQDLTSKMNSSSDTLSPTTRKHVLRLRWIYRLCLGSLLSLLMVWLFLRLNGLAGGIIDGSKGQTSISVGMFSTITWLAILVGLASLTTICVLGRKKQSISYAISWLLWPVLILVLMGVFDGFRITALTVFAAAHGFDATSGAGLMAMATQHPSHPVTFLTWIVANDTTQFSRAEIIEALVHNGGPFNMPKILIVLTVVGIFLSFLKGVYRAQTSLLILAILVCAAFVMTNLSRSHGLAGASAVTMPFFVPVAIAYILGLVRALAMGRATQSHEANQKKVSRVEVRRISQTMPPTGLTMFCFIVLILPTLADISNEARLVDAQENVSGKMRIGKGK